MLFLQPTYPLRSREHGRWRETNRWPARRLVSSVDQAHALRLSIAIYMGKRKAPGSSDRFRAPIDFPSKRCLEGFKETKHLGRLPTGLKDGLAIVYAEQRARCRSSCHDSRTKHPPPTTRVEAMMKDGNRTADVSISGVLGKHC